MRVLFNHGLTIEELYTNTPKKIIDRKWRWFIKHYGSTQSYEDAISDPFKYCIGLIINRMLDERVRFVLPVKTEAYLDFEIVDGDKFVAHRQHGRFREIDFIGSDFTGYAVRYFLKAKAYQKSFQLHFGGELKRKFLDNINSGIKYYSIKDVKIGEFLQQVYDKFPELTPKEIKGLILHGFNRLHSAMRYGCGITISTNKFGNCYFYIGALYLDPRKQMRDYCLKRDKKLRKIEGWKKPPYDGYYYIGLNPTAFANWLEENRVSRTLVKFSNVIPRKIMKELFYRHREIYIFRIELKKFKGWLHWAEHIKARNVRYMGKVENLVFTPSNETWKELIKTHEARDA